MFCAMHHKYSILGNVDLIHCFSTVQNVNLAYTSRYLALSDYYLTYEQLFPPTCLKKQIPLSSCSPAICIHKLCTACKGRAS